MKIFDNTIRLKETLRTQALIHKYLLLSSLIWEVQTNKSKSIYATVKSPSSFHNRNNITLRDRVGHKGNMGFSNCKLNNSSHLTQFKYSCALQALSQSATSMHKHRYRTTRVFIKLRIEYAWRIDRACPKNLICMVMQSLRNAHSFTIRSALTRALMFTIELTTMASRLQRVSWNCF